MNLISKYEVLSNGKVSVKTPYADCIVDQCRKWAGKFDKVSNCWVLPASRLSEVQSKLGVNQSDLVYVRVSGDQINRDGQYLIGWYVLASRRSRDTAAEVYAELVAGEIPTSGGSVKYPFVGATKDAAFELWVPRDFAESNNLVVVEDADKKQNAINHIKALMEKFSVSLLDLS